MLGSGIMLGMTCGALSGGTLMRIGWRRSFFIIGTIGIIGNLVTIYIDKFWVLMIGRIIFGFSSGLISSISPKFLEESIP